MVRRNKVKKGNSLQNPPKNALDAQHRIQQHQKYSPAEPSYVTGGLFTESDVTNVRIKTAETNIKVEGLEKTIQNNEKTFDEKIKNSRLEAQIYTDNKVADMDIDKTLGDHKVNVVLTVVLSVILAVLAILASGYQFLITPVSKSIDKLEKYHPVSKINEFYVSEPVEQSKNKSVNEKVEPKK